MDAHRGLNDTEADRVLRELFHASGRFVAPEGMEARILQRITVTSRPIAPAPALIPNWIWLVVAGCIVVLTVYLYAAAAPTDEVGPIERMLTNLPKFPLAGMLSSPWLLVTVSGAVALLAMDTLLTRVRLNLPLKH